MANRGYEHRAALVLFEMVSLPLNLKNLIRLNLANLCMNRLIKNLFTLLFLVLFSTALVMSCAKQAIEGEHPAGEHPSDSTAADSTEHPAEHPADSTQN